MRKAILTILVGVFMVSFSGVAIAGMLIPASEKAKERAEATKSPVIEGGEHWALRPPGLEKIVFIHYKKGFAKPSWAGGGKGKPANKCYKFLGRGVKWQNLPVNYVVDPDNPNGLSEDFVTKAVSAAAAEWDNYTSADLFGGYLIDYQSSWDNDAPDGRNEILFGDYPEEGVIAITVVWGYFSGPPSSRKIIEFDTMFDTDFVWGDALFDSAVMDLQNIATHEIGHGVGLADLYDTVCREETMYGYSGEGETKKRDLNSGDINGIQELYGE